MFSWANFSYGFETVYSILTTLSLRPVPAALPLGSKISYFRAKTSQRYKINQTDSRVTQVGHDSGA